MKSIYLIKPYLLENRFRIVVGLLCLMIVDFLQLLIPRIIKRVVDKLATFQIDAQDLMVCALLIVGVALLIGIFRYIWRRCLIGMSRRVEEGLRNRLFAHIQSLSAPYFDKTKTGDLMAHATNDISHVRMATGMGMVALTDGVVLGTAAIVFMLYINVQLTLFVLIPMPLIVLSAKFFSKKMHRLYQQVQAAFSDLTETVRERFAGIRIIKAHNLERLEIKGLNKISRRYIKMNLNLAKITRSFFPLMLFFANLSLVIVIYLGGKQTIFFNITPGDFVAFISYLGLLTWPMMALGWVVNLIQRGGASLDRIDAILKTEPAIINPPDPSPGPTFKGSITLENVSFSYGNGAAKPGERSVLKGIDIRVAPGETLGVVGPPGSGKTSLLNLIARIYDVSEGSIQIDGMDTRRLSVDDLRSQISVMPQEAFLFASTIRYNITFGNTDVNEDDLIAAVKQASLYDTIHTFPKGLDTLVGEKGVILSGGQKQRITLARALMKKCPILILDDPVSQVDVETGDQIIRTIRSLARYADVFQTMIIISHRLSALQFAERIIALDQGRIVEAGTHDELMHHNEYYAKTYHLQAIEEAYRAR